MRQATLKLLSLLCLPLIVFFAGCGSTSSGSFTLNASTSSVTIAQGASQTFTVTASGANDFKGSISLAASGLPAGVTLTPATAAITPGGSVSFTLAASSTAAPGTTTVTVTGTSGSLTASTTVSLTVTSSTPTGPTADFALSVSPASYTLAAGGTGQFTVASTAVNGFSGNVAVSVSGLPSGVTASPMTFTVTPGTPVSVTLTAASTVAATTTPATIDFTGTSGSLSHVATLALTVISPQAPPDFNLALSPPNQSVSQGSVATTTLSATPVNGYNGTIAVSVGTLPAGVTVSPTSFNLTTATPVAVTFTVSASAAVGTSSIAFNATSGTIQHSISFALTITQANPNAPDFSLALTPSALSIGQGAADQSSLSVSATNGFAGTVSIAAGTLPTGITVSPLTFSLAPGTAQTISVAVDGATTPGTYTIKFNGVSGSTQHSVPLTVTVTQVTPPPPPDFSLALTPSSLTVTQGAVGQTSLSATAIDGFNGQINVTAGTLPSGITLDPTSLILTAGNPQGVNLMVDAATTPGTYTIDFTGVSGSTQHTVSLTLTVSPSTAPSPDFSLALTPAALSVAQGAMGQTSLSATALNGFTGQIDVTTGTLPNGITLNPSSATIAAGTPQSVSLAVDAATTPGTYTIDFTGVSGTTQHTVSLTLTVTQTVTPDFSLAVTPSAPATLTVIQGSSGTATVSATGTGGFADDIQVTNDSTTTPGIVVTPASFDLTTGAPVAVTVAVSSSVPTGTYTITFTGVSGSISRSASLVVTVNASQSNADFSLSLSSNTASAAQGAQSNSVQAYVTGSNGFNGDVTVTVTNLPNGVALSGGGSAQDGGFVSFSFVVDSTVAVGSYPLTVTGTSGSLTHSLPLTLNVTTPTGPPTITVTESVSSLTVVQGSVANLSVTVTGPNGSGPFQLSTQSLPAGITAKQLPATVASGVPQTVTVAAATTAQAGSYTVTFLGQINSLTGTVTLNLTVAPPSAPGFDVATWHYDNGRTGLNASERTLNGGNVQAATFGKLSTVAADASVDAQPLFISGLTIGTQTHNVLYVTTENDTVYAYDADSGALLWQTSVLGTNETASDDHGCSAVSPKIGITATPVIDRYFLQNGVIFLVAMSKDSNGSYHQRLHGLDLTTGAEISGSPTEITASYTPKGGATSTFNPSQYVERSALLLSNGNLYLTWAAPCQQTTFDYGSWVMAYNEGTLQQESVLDLTANGKGGAIWMSGAGPAADSDGNVFLATSKGTFDTTLTPGGFPMNGDYGNAFVKLQANNGVLSVSDYFEPLNGIPGSANYQDQGSGGVILIPDIPQTPPPSLSVAIGAGKDGNIYGLYRVGSHLGEYNSTKNEVYFTASGALPNGATSTAAYFDTEQGYAYFYGGGGDVVREFDPTIIDGTVYDMTTTTLGPAGATPVVSSPGDYTGILWLLDTTASGGPVLHAYDVNMLSSELYNSTQTSPRDTVDATGKYTVPVVVNGHVYVGTNSGVDIFGLLPH